jgi:O-antigen/teichoic acid export membrane protein
LQDFALFALVTPFLRLGFYGYFDFGVSSALVHYLAAASESGDTEEMGGVLTAGLIVHATAAFFVALICALAGENMVRIFSHRNGDIDESRAFVFTAGLGYACGLVSNPFFAALTAARRHGSTHLIGTVALLAELTGVALVANFSPKLSSLGLVYLFTGIFSVVLSMGMTRTLLDAVDFVSARCWVKTRLVLGYTCRFGMILSASFVGGMADRFLLSQFGGAAALAAYETASRIADIPRRVTQMALLPLFARAQGDFRGETYRRAFQANWPLSVFLYLLPIGFVAPLLTSWVGADLASEAAPAAVVMLGTGFSLALVTPLALTLGGTGRLGPLMYPSAVALTINFAGGWLLGSRFGFAGVLASMALAYGAVNIVFLLCMSRFTEFRIHDMAWAVFLSAAGGAVALGVALAWAIAPRTLWAVAGVWALAAAIVGMALALDPGHRRILRHLLTSGKRGHAGAS